MANKTITIKITAEEAALKSFEKRMRYDPEAKGAEKTFEEHLGKRLSAQATAFHNSEMVEQAGEKAMKAKRKSLGLV